MIEAGKRVGACLTSSPVSAPRLAAAKGVPRGRAPPLLLTGSLGWTMLENKVCDAVHRYTLLQHRKELISHQNAHLRG
jgi:hypothetical protein